MESDSRNPVDDTAHRGLTEEGWEKAMEADQPPDAQPVDAFEEALDEFEAIVWRGGVEAHMHKYKRPPEIEDAKVHLRATRYPPMTDEALEELLERYGRAYCGANATGHWGDVELLGQELCAIYAAALQQHPTGCYSREEVIQLIKRGRNSLPLADLEGNLANRILDEFDAEQEKGKP